MLSSDTITSMTTLATSVVAQDNPAKVQFANNFVSVSYVPSEFGDFTVVGSPEGNVRAGGAVLVSNGKEILLVNQNRYAVGRNTWEAPRGASTGSEDGYIAGLRELVEETGMTLPETAVSLGQIQPDSGILNSRVDLIFVKVDGTHSHVPNSEVVDSMWVPIEVLYQACVMGEIEDSYTLALVLRAKGRGLI